MGANEIASLLMNALEIEVSSYYQTQTSNHRYFGHTLHSRISTIIAVTIFFKKMVLLLHVIIYVGCVYSFSILTSMLV